MTLGEGELWVCGEMVVMTTAFMDMAQGIYYWECVVVVVCVVGACTRKSVIRPGLKLT